MLVGADGEREVLVKKLINIVRSQLLKLISDQWTHLTTLKTLSVILVGETALVTKLSLRGPTCY